MISNFDEVLQKKIEKGSTLYMVATPIGNMGDITLRALATLSQVDTIVCEDTRTSGMLLAKYGIKKPLLSFHAKSKPGDIEKIIERLDKGERVAYISDAGTPSISDPGCLLITKVRNELPNTNIVPIPGPSAITTAISVSGIPGNQFSFLGFIPQKKGRNKFIQGLIEVEHAVVLYESPHRVMKTLTEIGKVLGNERKVSVARELTKQFEEIFTDTIENLLTHTKVLSPKGEYVLIVWPRK